MSTTRTRAAPSSFFHVSEDVRGSAMEPARATHVRHHASGDRGSMCSINVA